MFFTLEFILINVLLAEYLLYRIIHLFYDSRIFMIMGVSLILNVEVMGYFDMGRIRMYGRVGLCICCNFCLCLSNIGLILLCLLILSKWCLILDSSILP